MRNLIFVLLLLSIVSLSTPAQTGKTRPRIVQPAATAPSDSKAKTAAPSSTPNARTPAAAPPVLRGASGGGGAAPRPTPPKPAPVNPKPEEVVEDDEVLKVETELVTIPVAVFDRDGRFITDLAQKDFQVLENGKPQEIAYLQKTEQPFTVVLMLDVSPSTEFRIDEIQDAAIAFVNQLKPNDQVMVIAFNEKIEVLSEPTSDRNRLARAIRLARVDGGTSLYDAVDFVINQRLNRIDGRKAVVLFSDGVDTTSRRAEYNQTLRDIEEFDATIFPVYYNTYNERRNTGGGGSPRRRSGGGIGGILADILGGGTIQIGGGGGAGNSRREYETGRRYVESLAERTGGKLYNADSTDNLDAAFSNIAEELRRQYSIGYYPAEVGAAGERKTVKVRVNRPNTIVRHRESYTVGEQKQNFATNFK